MDSLFDDVSLSSLKEISVEELLSRCIEIINGLKIHEYENDIKTIEELNRKKERIEKLKPLVVYLGELFRRNVLDLTTTYNTLDGNKNITYFLVLYKELFNEICISCKNKVDNDGRIFKDGHFNIDNEFGCKYRNLVCYNCCNKNKTKSSDGSLISKFKNENGCSGLFPFHPYFVFNSHVVTSQISKQLLDNRNISIYNGLNRNICFVYCYCFKKLQEIQMVKQTMLKIMKTPLLTKELEECMDEILDLNGNKISQMKEYLTEEQYRFVRSGAKFEELEGQQEMLDNLNKMLKQLKICAVGQSVLEPPIAYAILVPPAIQHLEKELTSHKKRQIKHEKDLEKLKCKI